MSQKENIHPLSTQEEDEDVISPNFQPRQNSVDVALDVSELEEQKIALSSKEIKRQRNLAIQLTPISTKNLKPIKVQHQKEGHIKIKESGQVVLYLPKKNKKLYFSPDGQLVLMKQINAISKFGTLEYKFERLPTRLRPWYKYVLDFVTLVRLKTPRIIYANNLLKCTMMEDDPHNSFEIEFSQARQLNLLGKASRKDQREVKVLYQKGSEDMEIAVSESTGQSQGVYLRSLAADGSKPQRQVTKFSFNIHKEIEELDDELRLYAEESLKAISICEEKDAQLNRQRGEGAQESYPIIIDERSLRK
ncbi:hypothetical protein FGO68_gene7458 [Halteria grandinella]|uniref:Cryptic POLO box 2 (CPB2) domain-containing protein n=1 Tax=Halteria grandinella TaxID=5974 RepID=A0A8J8SVX5_HALGN|nr:hypothetical protein FGO68_gene7458 [Halteria grandinella]